MRERLGVVQFIHPGKEQTKIARGFCRWNSATRSDKAWPHRRKFFACNADYIARGRHEHGLVGFWGEWEAPSLARSIPARSDEDPHFVHLPALSKPHSYDGLLDTDPFVFGERFLYCGCQQHTAHHHPDGARETFLRRLLPGSLILFGSSVAGRFVLDTAFLTHDSRDYPNAEFATLKGFVPAPYYGVSLYTQAAGNLSCDSFRLYRGTTPADGIGEAFSFTPCRPFAGVGFRRPTLDIPGVITPILTQGKKFTEADAAGVITIWREVRRQVEAQACALAYHVALAPKEVPHV